MPAYSDYRTVLGEVRKALVKPEIMLIGIEGRMCDGKSTLADRLASDLTRNLPPPLHVDDYRPEPVPNLPYMQTLDLSLLAGNLDQRRKVYPTTASIIEGICLREVLAAIGHKLDLAVYVKRLSSVGLWHTPFDVENSEDNSRPKAPKVLYDDEIRYHREYRPHEIADLYFEWTDMSPGSPPT